MTDKSVKKINNILLKNNIDIKKYNVNLNLIKVGIIDSMQLVILMSEFENNFKIKINSKYFYNDNFGSIKSFYKIIQKIINANKKSKKE
jgi:acyl carrier protein